MPLRPQADRDHLKRPAGVPTRESLSRNPAVRPFSEATQCCRPICRGLLGHRTATRSAAARQSPVGPTCRECPGLCAVSHLPDLKRSSAAGHRAAFQPWPARPSPPLVWRLLLPILLSALLLEAQVRHALFEVLSRHVSAR